MAERTCKDCFHYKACKEGANRNGFWDIRYTEQECKHFLPTADVVEVVRCKDCIYGEIDNVDFPDQYLCHYHGSDWNEGNHFCSYGERKDK